MANRRMVSKSISISLQVNRLSDFAKLLFTWMIPHADDFGRLSGEPEVIKALVVPMMKQGVKEIEKALNEMVKENLVLWYRFKNEKVIQFIKFEEHQTGLNKRTKSRFPDPNDDEIEFLGISENFHPNRTKQNRTEEKGIEEKGTFGAHVLLTQDEYDRLIEYMGSEDTVKKYIESMNLYAEQIGVKKFQRQYASHYATLQNWYRRDKEKQKPEKKGNIAKALDTVEYFKNLEGVDDS